MTDKMIMDSEIAPTDFRRINQSEFQEIDYLVTGCSFDIQNELGRFFDEKIYRDELAARLAPKFASVRTEVPVIACFRDFQKTYFADLCIGSSAIFELKVVSSITNAHKSQLLNYLFLSGLAHGKVVNFGSSKVTTEFVSTALTTAARRLLQIDRAELCLSCERSNWFWNLLCDLLNHFGSFLDTVIYYDAIKHFAEWEVIGQVDVLRMPGVSHRAHLLSPQTAFKITSYANKLEVTRSHLLKFLNNTNLKQIHWINIYRHQITATTLAKP